MTSPSSGERLRSPLARFGFSPHGLVLVGLFLGLIALPLIARRYFWAGLAVIVLSRILAVLGRSGARELAQRLDPVFLASLPFAFALADPARAPVAAFVLFGFVVSVAAGPIGLAEMLIVSAAFVAACVVPGWFSLIAYALGIASFLLAGLRLARERA